MAYHKIPNGVLAFVTENSAGRSSAELAAITNAAFGTSFTAASMKGYKSNHGIRSGIKPRPPSIFPKEIQAFIKANCTGTNHGEMAAIVNARFNADYSPKQMQWFYQNNKLNIGVRTSWNTATEGTVITDKDGYLRKKTTSGKWELLHRIIWEDQHGPIPPGYKVTFLDGNTQNVSLENLRLVSNAEQMILTRDNLRFSDQQLTETGILIAKVKAATGKQKKRGGSDAEQKRYDRSLEKLLPKRICKL